MMWARRAGQAPHAKSGAAGGGAHLEEVQDDLAQPGHLARRIRLRRRRPRILGSSPRWVTNSAGRHTHVLNHAAVTGSRPDRQPIRPSGGGSQVAWCLCGHVRRLSGGYQQHHDYMRSATHPASQVGACLDAVRGTKHERGGRPKRGGSPAPWTGTARAAAAPPRRPRPAPLCRWRLPPGRPVRPAERQRSLPSWSHAAARPGQLLRPHGLPPRRRRCRCSQGRPPAPTRRPSAPPRAASAAPARAPGRRPRRGARARRRSAPRRRAAPL